MEGRTFVGKSPFRLKTSNNFPSVVWFIQRRGYKRRIIETFLKKFTWVVFVDVFAETETFAFALANGNQRKSIDPIRKQRIYMKPAVSAEKLVRFVFHSDWLKIWREIRNSVNKHTVAKAQSMNNVRESTFGS